MSRRKPEPNWRTLERIEKDLLKEFAGDGVSHIEYVIAFSEPFDYWVWLGTTTDTQRDRLAADNAVDGRIRAVASRHDLEELYEGFTVESQETVDRDFEGSWFYRLR